MDGASQETKNETILYCLKCNISYSAIVKHFTIFLFKTNFLFKNGGKRRGKFDFWGSVFWERSAIAVFVIFVEVDLSVDQRQLSSYLIWNVQSFHNFFPRQISIFLTKFRGPNVNGLLQSHHLCYYCHLRNWNWTMINLCRPRCRLFTCFAELSKMTLVTTTQI